MDLVVFFYRSNKSILFIKDLICRQIFEVFPIPVILLLTTTLKNFQIKDGWLLKCVYCIFIHVNVTNKQIQIQKQKIINITQKEPKFIFF